MRTEANTQVPSWLAVTLAMPRVDPLAVPAARTDWVCYWEQPSLGEAAAGFGKAAVELASERSAVFESLSRLCRPDQVHWVAPHGAPRSAPRPARPPPCQ